VASISRLVPTAWRGSTLARPLRRGLATEVAPAADNSKIFLYIGGMASLCTIQFLLPEPKPKAPEEHPSPKKRAAPAALAADPAPAPAAPTPAAPTPAATKPAVVAVAAETAEQPAVTAVVPPVIAAPMPIVTLPPLAKDLGIAGEWHIYEESGCLFGQSRLMEQAPLQLTPPGVKVGTVLLGKGEILAELDGFGPGVSQLYRIALPDAELPDSLAPEPVPDTLSPAGVATPAGSVTAWITTGSPLAVRGALVDSGSEGVSLVLREQAVARLGSAAWLATCRRLGLPEPPEDPHGPPLFSEWHCVAHWEAEQAPPTLLGWRDETAWLLDKAEQKLIAVSPNGERRDIRFP